MYIHPNADSEIYSNILIIANNILGSWYVIWEFVVLRTWEINSVNLLAKKANYRSELESIWKLHKDQPFFLKSTIMNIYIFHKKYQELACWVEQFTWSNHIVLAILTHVGCANILLAQFLAYAKQHSMESSHKEGFWKINVQSRKSNTWSVWELMVLRNDSIKMWKMNTILVWYFLEHY